MKPEPKNVGAVFFCIGVTLCVAEILSLIRPDMYRATTRIRLEQQISNIHPPGPTNLVAYDSFFLQTEFEVLQSEVVLRNVVESHLFDAGLRKKPEDGKRKIETKIDQLKQRMELRPVRCTSLVEIRILSEDPNEAARTANEIAESYLKLKKEMNEEIASLNTNIVSSSLAASPRVEIVNRAFPPRHPIGPNRPLGAVMLLGGLGLSAIGIHRLVRK